MRAMERLQVNHGMAGWAAKTGNHFTLLSKQPLSMLAHLSRRIPDNGCGDFVGLVGGPVLRGRARTAHLDWGKC